jgi:hypothetical protein
MATRVTGRVQLGSHDGGQADRAGSDDRPGVAGLDPAVEDTDLVAGGKYVGQHEELLVADRLGCEVGGGVGVGHPYVFGLGAVDEVTEDPAAATQTLARMAVAAVAATSACADARHQHPVTGRDGGHARAYFFDGPKRLTSQDAPVGDLTHVTVQDVQVAPADGGGIDPDDGVGVASIVGSATSSHAFDPGP